jgi:hypothetical protein
MQSPRLTLRFPGCSNGSQITSGTDNAGAIRGNWSCESKMQVEKRVISPRKHGGFHAISWVIQPKNIGISWEFMGFL